MKLILGSKSPRRKELLSLLGYSFEIRTKDTDETFSADVPISEVAQYVAHKKAKDLLVDLDNDEVVICADTIVMIDDKILGKPADREEAISMLERISGREHLVITGVVIASLEKTVEFSVKTTVCFYPLSGTEIRFYVDEYKPFDKAGSYGIQEWIGGIAIQSINGSYNNVVGLPTHEVYRSLKDFE
jgi:septum formation protein